MKPPEFSKDEIELVFDLPVKVSNIMIKYRKSKNVLSMAFRFRSFIVRLSLDIKKNIEQESPTELAVYIAFAIVDFLDCNELPDNDSLNEFFYNDLAEYMSVLNDIFERHKEELINYVPPNYRT